jgi:hypothetical protein
LYLNKLDVVVACLDVDGRGRRGVVGGLGAARGLGAQCLPDLPVHLGIGAEAEELLEMGHGALGGVVEVAVLVDDLHLVVEVEQFLQVGDPLRFVVLVRTQIGDRGELLPAATRRGTVAGRGRRGGGGGPGLVRALGCMGCLLAVHGSSPYRAGADCQVPLRTLVMYGSKAEVSAPMCR